MKVKPRADHVAKVGNDDISIRLFVADNGTGLRAATTIAVEDSEDTYTHEAAVADALTAAEKTAFVAALKKIRDHALDGLGFIDQ
ncbi:MAG: hypothetical protein GWN58_10895 [Anaerolineae bacterium]|nr:hypothetical protein [Anaerolineae bacterium]